MDYKNKIKKYISKIKSISQNGGNGEENVFTVYTTGIADWGNLNLIKLWHSEIKPLILSKILPAYNIKIIHYDPLKGISTELLDGATQNNFYNYVFDDNIMRLHKNEEFHEEYFPIRDIPGDTHIIVDFAHIFEYTNRPGEVFVSDPKLSQQEKMRRQRIKLHSIYLGYLGRSDNKNGIPVKNILNIKSLVFPFYITPTRRLFTYIDHMIIHQQSFDTLYPNDLLFEYCANIINYHVRQIFPQDPWSRINLNNVFLHSAQLLFREINISEFWSVIQ
jgi:hypothetical protein